MKQLLIGLVYRTFCCLKLFVLLVTVFFSLSAFGQFTTNSSNSSIVYLTNQNARLGIGVGDPFAAGDFTGRLNIKGNIDFKGQSASIKGAARSNLTIEAGIAGSASEPLPLLNLVGSTNCPTCIPGSVNIISGSQANSSVSSSAPLEVGWNTISIGNGVDHNKLRNGNYKLGVAGKIIAEELVVKLLANWPDYVFNDSYKLQPISELESFIKANKHLPGIPSECEIKERDGLAVSEMLTKQMQKIEELTLYLIEQDKKIKSLESRLEMAESNLNK